ncbi:homoserine dehydrogenase [candidate division WOR-3 bacterium]|nr:homoserine dehydrogenase [candidate division WOR-3 bacterium]
MKLALIGLGTVNRGLLELLLEKKDILQKEYNFNPLVTAISDPVVGSVFSEKGLNIEEILALLQKDNNIKDYPDGVKGWDSEKTIKEANADTIVEATPTNLKTGEPGLSLIRTALNNKKNVVTTNKGPIVLAYRELKDIASKNDVGFRFEGTVLSGTPVINLAESTFKGIEIKEVRGIMNGTANYILTKMEIGLSYEEALKKARKKGIAEEQPEADIKGWDSAAKIVIVANVLMGGDLKIKDVSVKGIDTVTEKDIIKALKDHKHWKLIASVKKTESGIIASVAPEILSDQDPLSKITGSINAINFTTDTLGNIMVSGPGAGKRETGYALLSDLLYINKTRCI